MSPLVFSTVILIDPAVSGFIVWVAGLESAPPLLSWIGGAFIIAGVFYVTIGEYCRKLADEKKAVPVWVHYFDPSMLLRMCCTGVASVSASKKGYDCMDHNDSGHLQGGTMDLGMTDFEDMSVMTAVELEMTQSPHFAPPSLSQHGLSAVAPILPHADSPPPPPSLATDAPPEEVVTQAMALHHSEAETLLEGGARSHNLSSGFTALESGSHIGIPMQRRISGSSTAGDNETCY